MGSMTETEAPPKEEIADKLKATYEDSVREVKDPLEKAAFRRLLVSNQDLFVGPEGLVSCTTAAEHSIDTGDAHPLKAKNYWMSQKGHEVMDHECEQMLKKGVIRESFSPWCSPVLLVTQKNGEVHLCIDYRRLNAVTIKDSYPLPLIKDTLSALGGCSWFSTLDLAAGFWQTPVKIEYDPTLQR